MIYFFTSEDVILPSLLYNSNSFIQILTYLFLHRYLVLLYSLLVLIDLLFRIDLLYSSLRQPKCDKVDSRLVPVYLF